MDNNDTFFVPAVEKTLDILEYLSKNKSVTLKNISQNLNIPIASAFRIVKHLCQRGYIVEEQRTSLKYSLGNKIYSIYSGYLSQPDLLQKAKPFLNELSEKCGQTSQLAILKPDGIMYIDQSLPSVPVSIIAPLHTILPINISAAGKVLVADLDLEEREIFVKRTILEEKTSKSIVNIEAFLLELQNVNKCGVGSDYEEFAVGIGCLAAPVYDYTNKAIAAVGITGHIHDYIKNDMFLTTQVKDAATNLSIQMGFQKY